MSIPHIIRSVDLAYAWSYQFSGGLDAFADAWAHTFDTKTAPLTCHSVFLMPEFEINQIDLD